MTSTARTAAKLFAIALGFLAAIVAVGATIEMLATSHLGSINLVPVSASSIASNVSFEDASHTATHVTAASYVLALIVVAGLTHIYRGFLKERAAA